AAEDQPVLHHLQAGEGVLVVRGERIPLGAVLMRPDRTGPSHGGQAPAVGLAQLVETGVHEVQAPLLLGDGSGEGGRGRGLLLGREGLSWHARSSVPGGAALAHGPPLLPARAVPVVTACET